MFVPVYICMYILLLFCAVQTRAQMASKVEIIIGTYEEFVLGYRLAPNKTVLQQSFADKSHSGSVRCVAVNGKWIATGGRDDKIFIYDMTTRTQHHIIQSHQGTVNSLAFTPDNSHLLSAGDDGCMVATRLNTWQKEGDWKNAHNGQPVTEISCHPSGKMALSMGDDVILRTWNLVKGRVAYKTNLKNRTTHNNTPDCLSWSPNGEHFTIAGLKMVEIWSANTADVALTIKTSVKPSSICWITDDIILIGLANGNIMWVPLNAELKEIQVHTGRVKAMAFHKGILATASSLGIIKLWQVNIDRQNLKELGNVNIGCRPICLALLDLEQFGNDYPPGESLRAVAATQIKENPRKTPHGPERSTLACSSKAKRPCAFVRLEYDTESKQQLANDDD